MTTINGTATLALDDTAQRLLFHEARTVNAFGDEPVTDEQIQAIYELVKWAPTSYNTSPLRIVLVRTPEARARLVDHMAEPNKAKTAAAPLTAILAADTNFHDHLDKLTPAIPNARNIFLDDDYRVGAAKLNATLQVGYFILGIRAAGLAAGPMSGFDGEGVRKEFFDGTSLEPLVVVNIGKPDHSATYPRAPRLDYDEAVSSL